MQLCRGYSRQYFAQTELLSKGVKLPGSKRFKSAKHKATLSFADMTQMAMNYFTPELFIAFNSPDSKTSRAASRQWDKAVVAYDKHLRSIRRKLPRPVRRLSSLYLHDSEFLEFEEVSPNGRGAVAHLVVRQHGEIIFLSYFLLDKPSIAAPMHDEVFSPQAVQWLYDELECHGPGDFGHEILFSDGRVIRLRFEHVSILAANASPSPVGGSNGRTSVST